jgi:hypothetical protein
MVLKETLLEFIHSLVDQNRTSALLKMAFEVHGIDGILSRSQVLDACQIVKRAINKLPAVSNSTVPSFSVRKTAVGLPSLGPEKWFKDSALGMAGRVDLTYCLADGVVHVVDFKTSSVFAGDGPDPKDDFLLQVAAYGLLIKRALNAKSVMLELAGAATSWLGTLDTFLESRVIKLATELKKTLPAHSPLDAVRLAIPGTYCKSCAFRPSCKTYNDALGASNRDGANEFLAMGDFVGQIKSLQACNDLAELRIRAVDGENLWVVGIPLKLYSGLTTGAMIHAYGLRSFEAQSHLNRPSNFYVYRVDNAKASAFDSLISMAQS